MNDPQIWTLLGIFAAVTLGGMTLMTTLLTRTMASGFAAMDARFEGLRGEMDARFIAVDARFDAMNTKFDHLDREVAALSRRIWEDRPGS